jgi:hypothetical protein
MFWKWLAKDHRPISDLERLPGGKYLARIHDPVRIESMLDPVHQRHFHRRADCRQLIPFELADSMFG